MLKYIKEFQRYILITGFRNVKIRSVDKLLDAAKNIRQPNVHIQIFDAGLVATWRHLYFAALNALVAFKNKENISKSLTMETLLYASTQHQIKKATEIIGVKNNARDMAVIIIGKEPQTTKLALSMLSEQIGGEANDTVLELSAEKTKKIKNIFHITDAELEAVKKEDDSAKALVDIVVEHMALLSTER